MRPDQRTIRLMIQLTAVAILTWQAWAVLVPEHRRTLMRMRAADLGRRAALRGASWAGRHGIATEAATGTESRAAAWYACASWLASSAAGTMQRAYDRARER
jgi:hypothetical protein